MPAAALSVLCVLSAHAQMLKNAGVKASAQPFSETRYGYVVEDPCRWMEDPTRKPDLLAYITAQSAAATAGLRALPGRNQLATLIDGAARAGTRRYNVTQAGEYTFWSQLDATDRVPKLMIRSAAGVRVLCDPAQESGDPAGPAAINSYSASPDGKTVAVHISYGGAEIAAIRFLDSRTGHETLARLSPVWSEFKPAWLHGGQIAFTRMGERHQGEDEMQGMTALVGVPGGPFKPILGPDMPGGPAFPRTAFPLVVSSEISGRIVGLAANAGGDPSAYVARAEDIAAAKPVWRQVASPADKIAGITMFGDFVYMVSNRQTSDGQVMRVQAAGGTPQALATPQGFILSDITAAQDGVYYVGRRDGVSHLFWLPGGKGPASEIALPFEADLSGLDASGDRSAVTITLEGWATAPRSYVARGGKLATLGVDSDTWPAAGKLTVRREAAHSADGTEIPMVIIDQGAGGTRPALIESYGSYGISNTTPWYNPYFLAWSARGNAMVYCGTRGGSERGRAWHDGGRLANKPRAQADLVACAERLVTLGIARPKGIAVTGTSAGGVLVPLAAEKRPDLFGALLSRVAILNATRLEVADNGANQFGEMGDPHSEEGWRALAAEDAYLGLASATDLPDTLIMIGLNDHRVAPWMSAKFAARAQEKFGNRRLVLIRAEAEGGHGIGSARDLQVAEFADSFAFLEDRLRSAKP